MFISNNVAIIPLISVFKLSALDWVLTTPILAWFRLFVICNLTSIVTIIKPYTLSTQVCKCSVSFVLTLALEGLKRTKIYFCILTALHKVILIEKKSIIFYWFFTTL